MKSISSAMIIAIIAAAAILAVVVFVRLGTGSGEKVSQEVVVPTKAEVRDLYDKGEFKAALPELTRLAQEHPKDTEILTMLASALWLDGQGEQALEQYQEILKLTPDDADTRYRLGILLRQSNKLNEAVKELEKAARARPGSALFLSELAKAYAKQGRYQEAVDNWQGVVNLGPAGSSAQVTAYIELGDALALSGEKEAARQAYEAGLAIKPDHDYLRSQLEKL